MPAYKYVAKDRDGKTVTGTTEVDTHEELVNMLREKGLIIINVTELKKKAAAASPTFMKERIKQEDLVIFSRQLATMVSAGIPLVNALDILGDQVEKKTFSKIIRNVRDEVESGKSLSEGLAKHADIFSNLFVNMVKAGESSGMLDEILDRLALYLEKTSALQEKVRSAMIYPAIISAMAVIVTLVLLIKVIPIFKDIYEGFGAQLPVPTEILIIISDFLRKYFLLGLGFFVAVFIFTMRFSKTEKGRLMLDAGSLKMPVFGTLIRKVAVGKFTRTFSTLVRSGVPILGSLEIVGKTAGNKVIEKAVDGVRNSIREGETIADPLQKSGVFPPMVVRMISVGEKTGELEKMLSKIADFYDEQVDTAVSGLTSMIEPLIIAFLGVVIGGVVICMFLPIFKLSTLVSM